MRRGRREAPKRCLAVGFLGSLCLLVPAAKDQLYRFKTDQQTRKSAHSPWPGVRTAIASAWRVRRESYDGMDSLFMLLGAHGQPDPGVCPVVLEAAFVAAHADGYGLYERGAVLDHLRKRLHRSRKRSNEIEYLLAERLC